jgi:uncharacterized membrane protein
MIWHELNVSDDTRKLLDEVVHRKASYEKLKRDSLFWSVICFILILIFLLYTYLNNVLLSLSNLLEEKSYLLFIVGIISTYIHSSNLSSKASSMKKKLEELRKEAIDQLNITWLATNDSETRDKISSDMKTSYGVNIIYKN